MAEWKVSLGEAEMKRDDSTYTLTYNAIPGRKVPVRNLRILVECIFA